MRVAINAMSIRPGGGLTVVKGLVQSLATARPAWRVTICCSDPESHRELSQLETTAEVHLIPCGDSWRSFLWQNLRMGRWLVRHEAAVLLSVNSYCFGCPCPQVVYHLNLRRFVREFRSGRLVEWAAERVRDAFAAAALKRAAANVFESQYLLGAARSRYQLDPTGARVIYIGLPDDLISLGRSVDNAPGRPRRILALTSPQPHKDNATLVRTLAALRTLRPDEDWRLQVAARINDPAWGPIHTLAQQLGMEHRIDWLGFRSQAEITPLMRQAFCLVSTSQLESFCMVALEAMARGCPAIVCDCASMPESVGAAGLLASPGDATSFCEQVLRLVDEPGLRESLTQRGYERVQAFPWSACGEAFAHTCEQASSSPPTESGAASRVDKWSSEAA